MKPSEAAQILEALARGVDPETGELFPEDSPLNSVHVIRALFMGAQALTLSAPSHQPKVARVPEEGLEYAWQPWTKDEEDRLLAAFDQGASFEALASTHRRKVGGIKSRLVKLGRVDPNVGSAGPT